MSALHWMVFVLVIHIPSRKNMEQVMCAERQEHDFGDVVMCFGSETAAGQAGDSGQGVCLFGQSRY